MMISKSWKYRWSTEDRWSDSHCFTRNAEKCLSAQISKDHERACQCFSGAWAAVLSYRQCSALYCIHSPATFYGKSFNCPFIQTANRAITWHHVEVVKTTRWTSKRESEWGINGMWTWWTRLSVPVRGGWVEKKNTLLISGFIGQDGQTAQRLFIGETQITASYNQDLQNSISPRT